MSNGKHHREDWYGAPATVADSAPASVTPRYVPDKTKVARHALGFFAEQRQNLKNGLQQASRLGNTLGSWAVGIAIGAGVVTRTNTPTWLAERWDAFQDTATKAAENHPLMTTSGILGAAAVGLAFATRSIGRRNDSEQITPRTPHISSEDQERLAILADVQKNFTYQPPAYDGGMPATSPGPRRVSSFVPLGPRSPHPTAA